jgi:pilus assembly protein FimV
MFRKSALAMAMLGALTTADVVALGLGDIELKSALNQPLEAEVELLSASPEELQELKVEVASAQAFAAAGVERTLFLSKLKFNVVTNAEGRPVVQITSRDVVREPFLDFLLQLSWSKGRLLREYTVLVDPPVTMPAPAPAPQYATSPPSAAPSAPVAPQRRVTHTAQMPPLATAPGEYRVQRNDTLWQVAQQVRPDSGVSIEQTMLGLLRTNPEAFYDNNINRLKAGYVLRVPDREELTRLSQAEARAETRRQYQAWRESQGLLAPADSTLADQAVAPQPEGAGEASLQLVAPESAEGDAVAGAGGESAELDVLQNDLMIANEALEVQKQQSEEMSTRLSVLEEQIQNMQRLIQLKDDELARLQAQVSADVVEGSAAAGGEELAEGEQAAGPMAGAETGEDTSAAQDAAVGEAAVAGQDVDAEPATVADMAAAPDAANVDMPAEGEIAGDQPAAADGVPPQEQSAPSEDLFAGESFGEIPMEAAAELSEAESAPVTEPAEVVEPVAVAEPQPAETFTSPGFVEKLLANPLWLGTGAVLLVIAGLLGLRRKHGSETDFQESILQAAQEKASGSDSEIIRSEPDSTQSTTTASSLLSEFAVSDMGSMRHDGEADPLAEADVYLAYGRFQQAEDLIKDALQNAPEQEDLNLKLLEVYLAARNSTAFDERAQAMLARLENSEDPAWEKVSEMGRELSPDNPLYQPGGASAPELRELEDEIGESLVEVDSVDASADMPDDELVASDSAMQEQVGEEEDGAVAAPQVPELSEELDLGEGLKFDGDALEDELKPDSLEFTPPEPANEEPSAQAQTVAELDGAQLDSVDVGDDKSLDFDLQELDLGADDEDLEHAGDGELADLDEVSTKLDLARAYLDMGDPDGARSILDEVIEEGSDDQKSEAQQIMDKIA